MNGCQKSRKIDPNKVLFHILWVTFVSYCNNLRFFVKCTRQRKTERSRDLKPCFSQLCRFHSNSFSLCEFIRTSIKMSQQNLNQYAYYCDWQTITSLHGGKSNLLYTYLSVFRAWKCLKIPEIAWKCLKMFAHEWRYLPTLHSKMFCRN